MDNFRNEAVRNINESGSDHKTDVALYFLAKAFVYAFLYLIEVIELESIQWRVRK